MGPSTAANADSARGMLRHTLATLAYRGGKALRDAPEGFAEFRVGPESRTPGQILAHIGDLLDWALSLAIGNQKWHDSDPLSWERGTERFFAAVEALGEYLSSTAPLACPPEKILQGPIADALTHVGQISMLRRLAGAPVMGENYFVAHISTDRIGRDQAAPVREFE
jgi:hypothetical protein